MKIHVSDGNIEFACGGVSRGLRAADFLASPLGSGAEVVVESLPYVTYRIRPEPGIAVSLMFEAQELRDVGWAMDLPGEVASDWSVETEIRRKKLHDDWLASELGTPPYRYPWGSVHSSYDDKGCASDIIVAYAK